MNAAILLCATLLAPADPAASGADARRGAVESHLLPAFPVEGVGWTIADRMRHYRVPGVAVAVIRDSKIDWVRGYGVRDSTTGEPVTAQTMFQAGSISKTVNAFCAMKLVQDGKLSLDADIDDALTSWKVPKNGFTQKRKLTLELLLCHRGGVTVHGFFGYHRFGEVPTLNQVLDGAPPANSDPITVDTPPGLAFRYAGGGTTIVQRAMIDVSGRDYPSLQHDTVFVPLGMEHSAYEQPLSEARWPDHSAAHLADGEPTPGKFQIHPELAAAGLWISAEDLAKFLIEIQLALDGKSEKVLKQATVERMTQPVARGAAAFGMFVEMHDDEPWLEHGGTNVGFQNHFWFDRNGNGVVMLTNGDLGVDLIDEILRSVAVTYGWEGFVPTPVHVLPTTRDDRSAAPGRYELADDDVLSISADGDALFAEFAPEDRQRIFAVAERTFVTEDGRTRITFDSPGAHGFEDAKVKQDGKSRFGSREEDDRASPLELLTRGDAASIDAAIAGYRERAAADADDIAIKDERSSAIVAALLRRGAPHSSLPAAFALARLNAELHPTSITALDTLGRVARLSGDREASLHAYETVLKLADASGNVADMFARFRKSNAIAALAELRGEKPK